MASWQRHKRSSHIYSWKAIFSQQTGSCALLAVWCIVLPCLKVYIYGDRRKRSADHWAAQNSSVVSVVDACVLLHTHMHQRRVPRPSRVSVMHSLSTSLTAPQISLSINILLWFKTRQKPEKPVHARLFLCISQWQVLRCRSGGSYSFNACQAPLASVQPIRISDLNRAPVFLSPSWKCHAMLKGLNYGDTSTHITCTSGKYTQDWSHTIKERNTHTLFPNTLYCIRSATSSPVFLHDSF